MDESALTDLKQFITVTVSQQTAELRDDIKQLDRKIDKVEEKLTNKIDDLSLAVAEMFEHTTNLMQHQFEDHELRITRLEQQRS